ncbi:MAG: GNAT family N-acetyltransferase [Chloroflexota bacterium]|nr:GNAT family N-acetyltransferase [Chloroflexota bacterium]
MFTLRLAAPADLPALQELIPLSARSLSQGWYSPEQIESAVRYVFGPDSQLIADGTYLVAVAGGRIVGCGGWSRRSTLYGGDQMKPGADPLLDPPRDAARIRAFFVHPAFARRGIGAAILRACMEAASRAGFDRAELMATLPGVPLYRSFGFEEMEAVSNTLPDGVTVPFVRMARQLGTARA